MLDNDNDIKTLIKKAVSEALEERAQAEEEQRKEQRDNELREKIKAIPNTRERQRQIAEHLELFKSRR